MQISPNNGPALVYSNDVKTPQLLGKPTKANRKWSNQGIVQTV